MADYLFETMTASDAASYTTADELYFLTGSPSSIGVQFTPGSGLTNDAVTLTSGTKSLAFAASGLGGETLHFFSNSGDASTLEFGLNTAQNDTVAGTAGAGARYFGLGGEDTIGGSDASDTIDGGADNDVINGLNDGSTTALANKADYLFGGLGDDTINGSQGNDHIYGNTLTTVAGAVDGDDSINAGSGNDYVNGNAGNDVIDGDDGNDRLYGGAGNDEVFGGNGNDYLQGNKGDDLLDGGDGTDELHGGAGNDEVHGGLGNDLVFGDNGNDTVYGDTGYDKLTGGAGNDVFSFNAGDADNANVVSPATATGHGVTDQILDFTNSQDTISFSFGTVGYVAHTGTGASFTDVTQAQTFAQQLLDAHTAAGTEVAAIQVGSDTYLFYNSATGAGTIDSAIKVVGVSDTIFTTADFV